MTVFELGAIGEFVGSIAVVITLIYLAIQVKLNTESIDENKRALVSQTFQARASDLQTILLTSAYSDGLSDVISKVAEPGRAMMVSDLDKLSTLTPSELTRYTQFVLANRTRIENIFFQYQHGFIDDEQYQMIKQAITMMHPTWKALGLTHGRASFRAEIDRLVGEQTDQ
jgi:hypothetical protein